MSTKREIVDYIRRYGPASGAHIAGALGVSRQAVNRHMRNLVEAGQLYKEGETRGARYHVAEPDDGAARPTQYDRHHRLDGLAEDAVFREVDIVLNLSSTVQPAAYQIIRYAFTEILNNAIDHSRSDRCRVTVSVAAYSVTFVIRDYGVGVFARIREYYDLDTEYSALQELLKGKRTVAPDRHSGEGLFFTSRIGDSVEIRSHSISIAFLNEEKDLATGEIPWMDGTEVTFSISRRTRKRLQDVFDRYAPEEYDYSFQRSEIRVKLYQQDYVSRSEGRRLVSGLDSFRHVILDFAGVTAIRQGFADEVFRVFRNQYPNTLVEVVNANPAVARMIRHVGSGYDDNVDK